MSSEESKDSPIANCPIDREFFRFRREFDELKDSQDVYQKKSLASINKVDEMHASITSIHQDTQHLSTLPEIAKTNKSMAENFETFCKKFTELEQGSLAAAIGRKQVPISVFFWVVVTLCLVIIGQAIGGRYFSASPTSVQFNTPRTDMVPNALIKSGANEQAI